MNIFGSGLILKESTDIQKEYREILKESPLNQKASREILQESRLILKGPPEIQKESREILFTPLGGYIDRGGRGYEVGGRCRLERVMLEFYD